MANWQDPQSTAERSGGVTAATVGVPPAARDVGLRSYMLSVYNYMTSGVLLTGIVALLFARGGADSYAAQVFMQPGILKWVIMLSPFALVLALSFGIQRMSDTTAKAVFWAYAALMGLS